ncbi:MAG: hypothetical protein J0H29_01430 [Sphingobacteriales bacterium]|nr:hypothetical protein [Sphingobacteriales bacterium]OJY89325.1 MAG: hypothetical protein BGP14_05320 [Sphingobacteriales bacterium 44-15]
MFKIFKRRRDKPSVMYGVFQKMGEAVERRQRKAADYLNRRTASLSRKQLAISLVLFCFLFGSTSAYTIWYSIHSPSGVIRVQPVRVPAHSILPDERLSNETELTSRQVKRFLQFRQYLDSLQRTQSGKEIYDSIARYRPGLLDSLAFIEETYHQQLKKQSDNGKKK